jgi:hypothetical protein
MRTVLNIGQGETCHRKYKGLKLPVVSPKAVQATKLQLSKVNLSLCLIN